MREFTATLLIITGAGILTYILLTTTHSLIRRRQTANAEAEAEADWITDINAAIKTEKAEQAALQHNWLEATEKDFCDWAAELTADLTRWKCRVLAEEPETDQLTAVT